MSDVQRTAETNVPVTEAAKRRRQTVRLGLALSGGGFRATLFHLGVLTRLAELDLLRHLSMISAVSGGSVLAAHYMLLLKPELEKCETGRLPRERYLDIVAQLREDIAAVLRTDPRNQLLKDSFTNLFLSLFGAGRYQVSLAQRMAERYQRSLYRRGTEALRLQDPDAVTLGPRLVDLKVSLPDLGRPGDIRNHNEHPHHDCIPELVLNAATLNTASRFTITFSELGDEWLGYIRTDERDLLASYRRVLDAWKHRTDAEVPVAKVLDFAKEEERRSNAPDSDGRVERFRRCPHFVEHLAWYETAKLDREEVTPLEGTARMAPASARRERVRQLLAFARGPGSIALDRVRSKREYGLRFLDAPFSVLRSAKVAAWYQLQDERWNEAASRAGARRDDVRLGGYTKSEHRERFWSAIRDVDQVLASQGHPEDEPNQAGVPDERDWYDFVLDLYYFRLAEVVEVGSPGELRLPMAVQASADFPPVFSAFHLEGFFDHTRVDAVQLSDGGLNDNNGVEALFDGDCTHIIASEAGPLPVIKRIVRWNRLGLMGQVVVNQLPIVRRLLMRTLREKQRVHEALATMAQRPGSECDTKKMRDLWDRYPVEAVAFFNMDTSLSAGVREDTGPEPLPPHPLARAVAQLRTDLDAFNQFEQDALLYQGYQYADRFVRRYILPKLPQNMQPSKPLPLAVAPAPLPQSEAERRHAERVLTVGSLLLRRAWRMGGPERWLWFGASSLGGLLAVVIGVLIAWGRSELLAPLHGKSQWIQGSASFLTWVAAALLWFFPTLLLFGFWLVLDGALAARAARRVPGGDRDH